MRKNENKKLDKLEKVKEVIAAEGLSTNVTIKTYNNFANSIEYKSVKKRDRIAIEELQKLLQTKTRGMIVFDIFGNVYDGYKIIFVEGDYIV